jgi:hypothetical protein
MPLESELPTDQIMVVKRTQTMNQNDSIDEYYIMGI